MWFCYLSTVSISPFTDVGSQQHLCCRGPQPKHVRLWFGAGGPNQNTCACGLVPGVPTKTRLESSTTEFKVHLMYDLMHGCCAGLPNALAYVGYCVGRRGKRTRARLPRPYTQRCVCAYSHAHRSVRGVCVCVCAYGRERERERVCVCARRVRMRMYV